MGQLRKEKVSPAVGARKIFGKPLQHLYRQLIQLPSGPKGPVLIRELCSSLESKGISYHPRTVKRQLLGNITYIPEALDSALLRWVKAKKDPPYSKLLKDYEKAKQELHENEGDKLFVSPDYFHQLANAYLYQHKRLSRRRLAQKLQAELKTKDVSFGLETIQAALSGKTLRIRKALQDQMLALFKSEGQGDPQAIKSLLEKLAGEHGSEIEKVEVGAIPQAVEAFLIKTKGISKRQFALQTQRKLKEKGYQYHLSSIQSVLEGKTRKTKGVILKAIQEILQSEGLDGAKQGKEYLASLSDTQRAWHQYVSATEVPELVQNLLNQHPHLTRRQIALILRESLLERNFDFSLNSLQYILGGKTKKTRGVLLDLLQNFTKPGVMDKILQEKREIFLPKKGRPSLDSRVTEAWMQFNQAPESSREIQFRVFMKLREQLIKKRWNLKYSPKYKPSRGRRSQKDFLDPMDKGELYEQEGSAGEDASVAYDVGKGFDRLVS